MGLAAVEKILGGKKTLHKTIHNRMDLIEVSNAGLTKEALVRLTGYLNISMHQCVELLPVTERTLQRYGANEHFGRVLSEHILLIAEVAARGSEVFEDKEKFIRWLNMPTVAFAKKTPLSLLNSKFGVDMVLDELGRIEHGVFS